MSNVYFTKAQVDEKLRPLKNQIKILTRANSRQEDTIAELRDQIVTLTDELRVAKNPELLEPDHVVEE